MLDITITVKITLNMVNGTKHGLIAILTTHKSNAQIRADDPRKELRELYGGDVNRFSIDSLSILAVYANPGSKAPKKVLLSLADTLNDEYKARTKLLMEYGSQSPANMQHLSLSLLHYCLRAFRHYSHNGYLNLANVFGESYKELKRQNSEADLMIPSFFREGPNPIQSPQKQPFWQKYVPLLRTSN